MATQMVRKQTVKISEIRTRQKSTKSSAALSFFQVSLPRQKLTAMPKYSQSSPKNAAKRSCP
jgi:hypothetical protein